MGTHTQVRELPLCDICLTEEHEGSPEPRRARYDAATLSGSWAFMCEQHFRTHAKSVMLGTGSGQRLTLVGEPMPDEDYDETLQTKIEAMMELGYDRPAAIAVLEDMGEL
jgi:hypothetical protein